MIYAGIMAAGLGLPMHRQDMPKPFLTLGNKPIIIHALEQFFLNPRIGRLIIAVPGSWKLYTEDMIAQYNTMGKDVHVIAGGVNKAESVSLLVKYIDETWNTVNDDILLTHDAIRPFVTQRIIDQNIDIAMRHGAASTVMITNDTILTSVDERVINDIPPKEFMYAQQTPQTYRLDLLKQVLSRAARDNISLNEETELSRVYMRGGNKIFLVQGEYFNMKIINSYDLEVANALLREKNRD
jgi:2-C-methyl-D-erythritol 4-phosphate cytidylyltransferase